MKHRPRPNSSGFSLVETALAVGVVAFAFVGLLALLPVGLTTFRTAMDTSIGSQIFQRVVTDIEQMEFDALLEPGKSAAGDFYALPIRYFDDQGGEVPLDDPVRIIYHARVRVAKPGPAALDGADHFTSLPAKSNNPRFSPRDTVFLTVQIAHNPGNRAIPIDERLLWKVPRTQEEGLALSAYSAVVTRNGYSKKAFLKK